MPFRSLRPFLRGRYSTRTAPRLSRSASVGSISFLVDREGGVSNGSGSATSTRGAQVQNTRRLHVCQGVKGWSQHRQSEPSGHRRQAASTVSNHPLLHRFSNNTQPRRNGFDGATPSGRSSQRKLEMGWRNYADEPTTARSELIVDHAGRKLRTSWTECVNRALICIHTSYIHATRRVLKRPYHRYLRQQSHPWCSHRTTTPTFSSGVCGLSGYLRTWRWSRRRRCHPRTLPARACRRRAYRG